MSVMLTIYQVGHTEAATVFRNAPAVPRMGEWFRYKAADGRTFKGLITGVEWLAYLGDQGETKMTAGIFLDRISVIGT